jgi:hypothetical protein
LAGGAFQRKEESSFCEQKEAKKLYPLAPRPMQQTGRQVATGAR